VKNILLISDTHGYFDERLVKHAEASDEVWHAGDIGPAALADRIAVLRPLRAVYGNIDGSDVRTQYPEDTLFEIEGLRVLMTHIAGSPGKYASRVRALIGEKRPGLLVCGHSHILKVQFDEQAHLLYMNPGAAGVQGFHHMRTALRFGIADGAVKDLAVIELGKRGG
jgi:uncharacterized protein